MAAIVKLPSGRWRAQVRRKRKYLPKPSFAKGRGGWGPVNERNIGRGVRRIRPTSKAQHPGKNGVLRSGNV